MLQLTEDGHCLACLLESRDVTPEQLKYAVNHACLEARTMDLLYTPDIIHGSEYPHHIIANWNRKNPTLTTEGTLPKIYILFDKGRDSAGVSTEMYKNPILKQGVLDILWYDFMNEEDTDEAIRIAEVRKMVESAESIFEGRYLKTP